MKRDLFILSILFVFFTAFLYAYQYFFGGGRMATVYKNWDGPSYVIAAHSLYDPLLASEFNIINSPDIRPDWTFLPAHFPLYPLAIRLFSAVGYFQAMLALSLGFAWLATLALYYLLHTHRLTSNPLLLTIPFLLIAPRWFVTSHVGGSEPMFMFFFIMFLNYFLSKRHLPAAIFASLAELTRPQGALIGLAVLVVALIELYRERQLKRFLAYLPYLLIPLALALVFAFYRLQTGSFWAFFSAISIFNHSSLVPFTTFTYPATNIETFWQEVNAIDYVIYFAAVLTLLRSRFWRLGIIGLIFFLPLPFLQHSDISRYALPLLPLAFIAFRGLLGSREFVTATLVMSPAVIRYAVNFMAFNHGA